MKSILDKLISNEPYVGERWKYRNGDICITVINISEDWVSVLLPNGSRYIYGAKAFPNVFEKS